MGNGKGWEGDRRLVTSPLANTGLFHSIVQPRIFFTGGNRAVYRGYRCYRWGTVTVPSGSNRWKNSNLNSKNEKSIKISKK
jgi:hypothetical protein